MTLTNTPHSGIPELLVVAALERYQAGWNELIGACLDHRHGRAVDAELEHIRQLIAALPRFSADLTEIVMRHAQLLMALAKPTSAQPKAAGVAALRKKHSVAIEGIRSKCLHAAAHALGSQPHHGAPVNPSAPNARV